VLCCREPSAYLGSPPPADPEHGLAWSKGRSGLVGGKGEALQPDHLIRGRAVAQRGHPLERVRRLVRGGRRRLPRGAGGPCPRRCPAMPLRTQQRPQTRQSPSMATVPRRFSGQQMARTSFLDPKSPQFGHQSPHAEAPDCPSLMGQGTRATHWRWSKASQGTPASHGGSVLLEHPRAGKKRVGWG
jgi:hypothetical protein